MFLNIYINAHLTHMILYCYGRETDLHIFRFTLLYLFELHYFASLLWVETQILTQ